MTQNQLILKIVQTGVILLILLFISAQVTAQPGYGTVNLALGKPITPLTGTVQGATGYVTNGKIDDAWYSYYPGPTNAFTIDLGAEYPIGKLGVYSTQTANFKVWSSTDGVVWTERHSYDWTADTGYTTPNLSAPVTIHPDGAYAARFFKYQGWAYWNQYVGIVEFEVYEWLSSAPPEPSLSGLTNLALGQPALPGYSYPSVVGHGPEFLTDGNTGTYWQGNYIFDNCTYIYYGCGFWYNTYGWAYVDLGSTQPVQAIRLTFPSNAAGSQTYLVSLANSGSNWTPYQWAAFGGDPSMVASNPALTSSTSHTFFLPAPVNARYVWINIVNWVTPGSPPPGLAEVEVFGEIPSPSPTPTPTPVCIPPPPDMVGWWPGDANPDDIQGPTYENGIVMNGSTYVAGMVGQAFSFDGIDDRILVSDAPALRFGTADVSVDAWVKAPPGNTYRAILGKELQSYPYPSIFFRLNEQGRVEFGVTDCGTSACGFWASRQPVMSTFRVDDDVFHHIVGVRNQTGYELYIDGELVATRTEVPRNGDNTESLLIGDQTVTGLIPFAGVIDEVEIINRALSQSEVQAIYNAGSGGKCKLGPPPRQATETSITCPASVEFDGTAKEPCSATVTGPNGFSQSVPVAYSNNTNAGTAAADASFLGDTNHLPSAATQVMFAITPAPSSTVVTCSPGAFVFNGSPQTPCTVSVTGAGGLTLSPPASYSNNVNAGTATASYAFLGDANHFPSSDSKSFEITRAPTVTSIVCSNVPYNGSPQTPCYATVTGPGGLSMLLSITYANNTFFGTAAASANYPGAPNYEPSSASVTFQILANVPINKDQCKNGGWQFLTRADGSLFTNQGDCIQYFNTGK